MENIEQLKVLIVDDEPVLCIGIKRVLENFVFIEPETNTEVKYTQVIVNSGEEAIEKMAHENFDLMFLDYKLPHMDGLQVLDLVRGKKSDILIIMTTAYASLETAVKATKLGAYDFLAKPFNPEELRYVTKKASMQIILAKKNKKFEEEKRKIRFEFLSVLAHELKAPLNAIEGYFDILNTRLKDDELIMLDRCQQRLHGMRRLIFDLLDLTRIESGIKTRQLASTNIIPIIQASIDTVKTEMLARNISIHLNYAADTEMFFKLDANEFEIVSNNLISNAVKYNINNGTVHISLTKENNKLTFSVKDSGIGIAKTDVAKLFNEFVRIKNESTNKILGSGLGLSTIKKLVSFYGGEIIVESEASVGSTFTAILFETNENQANG